MNKLVNSIAKMVEASEKIALPVLSAKLSKVAEAHPYDQTILAMANVVSSMAVNKTFISQSDLKSLYNKLYSRNTKFAEYFKDELGGEVNALSAPTLAPRNELPISPDFGTVADPILTNALNTAFGNPNVVKVFSKDNAAKAKKAVASNLDNWNLRASKLEVEAGNEFFIVVKADYDTPKGITSVLVPVEINQGKALEPVVFMANAGPKDLNHVNLKSYVSSNAGAKLKVKANDIIDVLTKTVTGTSEIDDVELALTKLNASKERKGDFGQIVGLTVDAASSKTEVNLPKFAEAESFEAKFNNPNGIAAFNFGSTNINLGREVIARQLTGFGLKNPQISVLSSDDSTVFYAVSVNAGRTAFKVPVKFANKKMVNPTMMLCNGSVLPLTKQTINNLFASDATDFKVAAVASPQYALTPADLINNVRAAVEEGNYAKAEDSLNVLQQQDNVVAYTTAFNLYLDGLNMKKTASTHAESCTCSMIVKSASSKHPICGHTGLPTHKVYQDAHGNCQPLYRRGMDESYEGGFFMNSKIFG